MHRCLCIEEILTVVAEKLDQTGAFHFALVCCAFYERAMDALWACTPHAFEKLLLCLPADAVYTAPLYRRWYREPNFVICCGLKREPEPSEWDRFTHHAKRIKEVTLSPFSYDAIAGHERMTLDALNSLRVHFGGGPVFHNLSALTVDGIFASHLDLFIPEYLSSCTLRQFTNRSLADMLLKLEKCAPQLRLLAVLPPKCTDNALAMTAQARILPLCQNLTSFSTFVPVTLRTLAVLATCPRLVSLELGNPVHYSEPPDDIARENILFASLDTLKLSARAQLVADVLRAVTLPVLKQVSITLDTNHLPNYQLTPTSEPALEDIMTALTSFTSISSLLFAVQEDPDGVDFIDGTSLLPLTQLLGLTNLNFDRIHVQLQPVDIAQLAAAWPHIQELGLAYRYSANRAIHFIVHPAICIEDLYPFAERCPALRTLAISVAEGIAPASPLEEPHAVHHGLRDLSLASSSITEGEERARVARFVRDVFPGARKEFHMWDRVALREIKGLLA